MKLLSKLCINLLLKSGTKIQKKQFKKQDYFLRKHVVEPIL